MGSQVPDTLLRLVQRFDRQRDAYTSSQYNEAQLREEFLNPFFEAMGWDIYNREGLSETYKPVIHEDSLKIAGATKAPDYCFRIGGRRVYFVEAKKPAVNVAEDAGPAFQLRRYAWTAKLPVSILTDFEEFAVYDCRLRPFKTDKPATARTMLLGFQEYEKRWEELCSLFSPGAIQHGALDRWVESTRAKKGTATVDDAFLDEISRWRDLLARSIALRNPRLSTRELNFVVQRTIDRLIFLRICEDRGIESYAFLQSLQNGERIYPRLLKHFRDADDRYNSGLFHFAEEKGRAEAPDKLSLDIDIDDKPLKDIIANLYYPDSPYEFSVLPSDILGQVYEQFLGKVIRLTAGHQAKVEEKPEVRKAGGVYYTPTYIVDYIVKNTVGKLLEGGSGPNPRPLTPAQVSDLRILDPACGSGSFLLGAYQYLLDWHLDYYTKHSVTLSDAKSRRSSSAPPLYQDSTGSWRLTTAERKRILLNNIYGVDIDSQAVEVTKLSLLLKVLEGESQETLGSQLKLYHERALPDLGTNIKCGNSLIGPDFYQGEQQGLFADEEERLRVNVFDWPSAFPDIMKRGGFDAVIGNPPYIRVRIFRDLHPEQIDYLESHYRCATHVWDIYLLIFERALGLTRFGGRFSFIVPIQTLHQPNCASLRQMLIEGTSLKTVADLSNLKVFQDAIVKNCVLVCEKGPGRENRIEVLRPPTPRDLDALRPSSWPQRQVKGDNGFSLKVELLSPVRRLCDKLCARSRRFGELYYVTFGLRSCAKGKGEGGKDRLITANSHAKNAKPYLEGREIGRYTMRPQKRYIRYIPSEMYSPRVPGLFESEKIVSQTMLSKMRLVATYDDKRHYVEQSLLCMIPHGMLTPSVGPVPSLKFALGVMNSTLESFYFRTSVIDYSLGGGLVHATPGSQEKLLLPEASEADVNRMVKLVERMLKLHKDLPKAKTPHEHESIERTIAATDKQIDELVYELYGLSEGEIRIVENAQ